MKTNIVTNEELKTTMKDTLGFLSATLSNTLGPYGSTTIIQDRQLDHKITKDGYSLLKKIYIEEEVPRTILDMVRTISRTLVRKVGDGSTSSIIIANALYGELAALMAENNVPAKDMLTILGGVVDAIAKRIEGMATPVSEDLRELSSIATVSTNNDTNYGELVAKIFQEIGRYGFITLEKSKTRETYYERSRGMEVPRGWTNQLMTTEPDEKTAFYSNPFVFMCEGTLTEKDLPQLADIIGRVCAQLGQPLVVVANGFDSAVESFFNINLLQSKQGGKKLPLVAIDIAIQSKRSRDAFNDLAANLGAIPYDKLAGEELDGHFDLDRLGQCERFKSTDTYSQFIEGNGDPVEIEKRAKLIREEIERLTVSETYIEYDKEIYELRRRLSGLENGTAVLYIGGDTESAKETDRFLLEDAVFACKSAIKYGYVIGGNLIVPIIIENAIQEIRDEVKVPDGVLTVDSVLEPISRAFKKSFEAVLYNYKHDADWATAVTRECVANATIYNLKRDQHESMTVTSIINSAETDIEIMRSAISIIGLLATSNQFIALNSRF